MRVAIAMSGLSVAAVARAAGVSASTIHRILSGTRDATATTLWSVARATGVTPARLVDGSLCKECITHD